MSHGFTYGVAYTRESAHDDSSYRGSGDNLPNAYDRTAVWGNSDFDRPNILVVHYLYELPFLRGSRSLFAKVAGGWSLSGVSQFQSGGWSSITTTDDFAGVGPGSGPQYWIVNGNPTIARGQQAFSHNNTDTNYWFAVTTPTGTPMFTAPANGTYAPAPYGRNIIEQPGFQNWNLAGFKTFRINERHRVTFRAEAFNWINHPNLSAASTNPRSANFGKVQGKNAGARVLQFSLRYAF